MIDAKCTLLLTLLVSFFGITSLRAEQNVSVQIYDSVSNENGQAALRAERHRGELQLSSLGSTAMTIGANVDDDHWDETVMVNIDGSNRIALLVYDRHVSNNVRVPFDGQRRIGDLRLEGGRPTVAEGNLDQDPQDEIVVASVDGSGRMAIMVYDTVMKNGRLDFSHEHRIGDLRLEGNFPSVALGNFDQDAMDEIAVAGVDDQGRLLVQVYDTVFRNGRLDLSHNRKIGELVLKGNGDPGITAGNFDRDDRDEIAISTIDNSGRISVLVYDTVLKNNQLDFSHNRRIGDLRLQGTTPTIASGNFDGDPRDELAIGSIDDNNRLAVMVYDTELRGGRLDLSYPRRIADMRLELRPIGGSERLKPIPISGYIGTEGVWGDHVRGTTSLHLGASHFVGGPGRDELLVTRTYPLLWTGYDYRRNHPSNREHTWSHETQGVTHDRNHWYLSKDKTLFKYRIVQPYVCNFGLV